METQAQIWWEQWSLDSKSNESGNDAQTTEGQDT
jgi:hypothetical protein